MRADRMPDTSDTARAGSVDARIRADGYARLGRYVGSDGVGWYAHAGLSYDARGARSSVPCRVMRMIPVRTGRSDMRAQIARARMDARARLQGQYGFRWTDGSSRTRIVRRIVADARTRICMRAQIICRCHTRLRDHARVGCMRTDGRICAQICARGYADARSRCARQYACAYADMRTTTVRRRQIIIIQYKINQ